MNKFLLHITSLVALVLFLTMGACNNTPKTPILLEAEKTIEKTTGQRLKLLRACKFRFTRCSTGTRILLKGFGDRRRFKRLYSPD